MPKNNKYTEAKRQRYLKEGRGQGEGENYVPWIKVQNFGSRGRASRPFGLTAGRVHHFFSAIETDFFYFFDWLDNVIDIREQYPLQRDITINLAKENNLYHPIDKVSKVYIDMTTDFLLTLIDTSGVHFYEAYTVKYSGGDLEKDSTIEKFEIERRYWKSKNIRWAILTKNELDKQLVGNIAWCREYIFFKSLDIEPELFYLFINTLKSISPQLSLAEACNKIDSKIKLPPGKALQIIRFLIANKKIQINRKCKWNSEAFIGDIAIDKNISLNEVKTYAC